MKPLVLTFLLALMAFPLGAAEFPTRLKCAVRPQHASMWTDNKREWEPFVLKGPLYFALDSASGEKGAPMLLTNKGNITLVPQAGRAYRKFSGMTAHGSPVDITVLDENASHGYPVIYTVYSPAAGYSLAVTLYTGFCEATL